MREDAARCRSKAQREGHLFVVSAPSGAGKTSLIEALAGGDPLLQVSVSHTTRPRRPAEKDGVHYHFVPAERFQAMRDGDEFLESATVFDHAYGTSRRAVQDAVRAGRDVVLEIDWQGARQVRQRWPGTVCVFVLPPSRQALLARLNGRGQDAADIIAKRTAQAVGDISHCDEFDHVIVNDDFDAALDALREIVEATRRGETLPRQPHSELLAALLST